MKAGDTCPGCGFGVLRMVLGVLLECYPYGCAWRRVFGEWVKVR